MREIVRKWLPEDLDLKVAEFSVTQSLTRVSRPLNWLQQPQSFAYDFACGRITAARDPLPNILLEFFRQRYIHARDASSGILPSGCRRCLSDSISESTDGPRRTLVNAHMSHITVRIVST